MLLTSEIERLLAGERMTGVGVDLRLFSYLYLRCIIGFKT